MAGPIRDPFDNPTFQDTWLNQYTHAPVAAPVQTEAGGRSAAEQLTADPRLAAAGGARRFPPVGPLPPLQPAMDPVWEEQIAAWRAENAANPPPVMALPPGVLPPEVPAEPAWPPGGQRGDGTILSVGDRHSVPYDPNDPNADRFGADAGFLTTLKASMVPATDPENVRKQIRIFSRNMKIPESRFFVDDAGEIRWVDLDGTTHKVVPTIGGGSWDQPLDMARRVGAQIGTNVGPSLAPVLAGVVGMRAGPSAAAATAAAVEGQRQILGNWLAGPESAYEELHGPPVNPAADLRPGNMAWHGLGAGAGELAAQTGGAVVAKFLEHNPFNLSVDEIRLLRGRLGEARQRAAAANELGLHATPYDLTDLPFLKRLETTTSRQPGVANDIMSEYYRQRAEINFPQGVQTLFARISTEGVPEVGLLRLRKGAERTAQHLADQAVETGLQGGWQAAINSGARPDIRPVVAQIRQVLPHVNGETRAQLNKLLGELYESTLPNAPPGTGSLVTDFEKLHNVRLDLDATLAKIRNTAPVAERGRLAHYLDPIAETYDRALNAAHPEYEAGTRAFQQSRDAAAELRDGLLTLLSQNPTIEGQLTSTLFNADPQTVARARALFEQAGQLDEWNAGVRAFFEDALRQANGPKIAGTFAGTTAPFQTHRDALKAALPPAERDTADHVLNLAQAQGRVPRPANRAEVESQRLEGEPDFQAGATFWKVLQAAALPFRSLGSLGGRRIDRVANKNAMEMADRLTGQRTLPAAQIPFLPPRPPTRLGPSTQRVMDDLEKTSRPFEGAPRHLLERMMYLNLQRAFHDAGIDPMPSHPSAGDLDPRVAEARRRRLLLERGGAELLP